MDELIREYENNIYKRELFAITFKFSLQSERDEFLHKLVIAGKDKRDDFYLCTCPEYYYVEVFLD